SWRAVGAPRCACTRSAGPTRWPPTPSRTGCPCPARSPAARQCPRSSGVILLGRRARGGRLAGACCSLSSVPPTGAGCRIGGLALALGLFRLVRLDHLQLFGGRLLELHLDHRGG